MRWRWPGPSTTPPIPCLGIAKATGDYPISIKSAISTSRGSSRYDRYSRNFFSVLSLMPGPSLTPELEIDSTEHKEPLFHVVLLDDDEHTYDYVIEMLQKLFFFSFQQALNHASEVDEKKRTILMTVELPMAEFAVAQIHSYGADYRMEISKGSMTAIIEPAS
jgi:ATP-dependent Clp protease adaptor protein ClpS